VIVTECLQGTAAYAASPAISAPSPSVYDQDSGLCRLRLIGVTSESVPRNQKAQDN